MFFFSLLFIVCNYERRNAFVVFLARNFLEKKYPAQILALFLATVTFD